MDGCDEVVWRRKRRESIRVASTWLVCSAAKWSEPKTKWNLAIAQAQCECYFYGTLQTPIAYGLKLIIGIVVSIYTTTKCYFFACSGTLRLAATINVSTFTVCTHNVHCCNRPAIVNAYTIFASFSFFQFWSYAVLCSETMTWCARAIQLQRLLFNAND